MCQEVQTPPPSPAAAFLRILAPHAESDIELVCRRQPRDSGGAVTGTVSFFCHREVLAQRCGRFQLRGDDSSQPLPAKRRRLSDTRLREEVDADDDVVFEVLRYVYCGTVHFQRGFLARFGQLLAVADHLGVGPDRFQKNCGSGFDGGGGRGAVEASAPTQQRLARLGGGGTQGLLSELGVERWLLGIPAPELRALLGQPVVLTSAADPATAAALPARGPLTLERRVAVLDALARLRPGEFSVQALSALGGPDSEALLAFHSALVHVSVVNLAGEAVLQLPLDSSARIAEIRAALYAASWAEDVVVSLVLGGSVLQDDASLQSLGAPGFGCRLVLGVVRQPLRARFCLCQQAAVRHVVRKQGPNYGRAFLRCSGTRGTQCPFFEWTE